MNGIIEKYKTEVIPALQKDFGHKNATSVPQIDKVVVNVGVGKAKDSNMIELAEKTIRRITGQHPVKTKAKKSIAGFKLREGTVVGLTVTLRGKKMTDFIEKLIHVTFPRVRDFRGLSVKSFDEQGNLSIGLKEHMAFPEIRPDEVEQVHGIEVTIKTTADNAEEGAALLKGLGFPFKK